MQKGITALELLIAIGILGLIAVISFSVFSNFRENSQLISAQSSMVGMLEDAHAKTLSSEGRSEYGVRFETSQAVFFKGATYDPVDPDNKYYILPNLVEVFSVNLTGGAADIYFERLTGLASATGTVIIRVKSDASKTKSVNIFSSGAAN